MPNYKLIDYPHSVPLREYDDELSHMAEWLLQFPQVSSVYQVGSVGAPGISDLDLVVVFQDEQKLAIQPLNSLSRSGKYLFIHNLYGCSRKQFEKSQRFSFFGTFKLLAGERFSEQAIVSNLSDTLKIQVALEFLLKMYVNLILQSAYKILRVRSLLLHVKGLLFDLEFLGVKSGRLVESIQDCMDIRKKWFDKASSAADLIKWFENFMPLLHSFLQEQLKQHTLFVSPSSSLRLAKNIQLKQSLTLDYKRIGISLPLGAYIFGEKIHKVLNKFNRFQINCPYSLKDLPPDIEEYFTFIDTCRNYNQSFIPHFYTLSSSLHI